MSWREVWERKGQVENDFRLPLDDLVAMDGFDKGVGRFSVANWCAYTARILTSFGIISGDSVCEIGCGAGVMLCVSHEQGIQVTGLDHSNSLIAAPHRAIPGMDFYDAEATQVPCADNRFDTVFSHSASQYFPNLDYAEQCLSEMYRIAELEGGGIAVLDIPDATKRDAGEAFRRSAMPIAEYERLCADYPHLYYGKEWSRIIPHRFSWSIEVFGQDLPGYGNAAYQFNVRITKT